MKLKNKLMEDKDINHGMKIAGTVAIGLLSLFLLIKTINEIKTYETIGQDPTEINRTIVVTGKGEVKAFPDVATFNWTVEEESTSSLNDAKNKAATKANAIMEYLLKAGVEKKNIVTTSYEAHPKYKNVTTVCDVNIEPTTPGVRNISAPAIAVYPPCSNTESVESGYIATQSVEVKLVNYKGDDNQLGALISGVTNLKPKYVSKSYTTIEDPSALKRMARAQAIEKAKEEANVLAKNLGVKLGKVVNFSDSGDYNPYPMAMSARGDAMTKIENVDPQITTGQQTITSNVSITYTIK